MTELFPFAAEHLLGEDGAKELTQPYWADFTKVWKSAWLAYGQLPEDDRRRLSETPLVPPVILFGYAQSFAKEIFANREEEGLVFCHELNVIAFYIQDKVLVRFNTLGTDYMVHSRHNGSERKEKYFNQAPIDGLNNAATRLTVGSKANAAKTDLEAVVISCQVGGSLNYKFQIDDADCESLPGNVSVMPPQPSDLSERQIRIKPR